MMSKIHAQESAAIDASPEQVYAILRDYKVQHPAILPREYFKEVLVKEGGLGAGTVIQITMSLLGTQRVSVQTVSEPEPGRVLVEAEPDGGAVTTFTVDPIDGGERTQLTIATDLQASPGVLGLIEQLVTPLMLRRVYRAELGQLAQYVKQK
jgi:hypothetical protein